MSAPASPPHPACPRCGRSAAPLLSTGGICLHCAGERVFDLIAGDATRRASSAVDAAQAPVPIGPYEIIEEIGHGGMGRVFAARHVKLGRIVALKVIPENPATAALELRFLREVQTVAQLRHPGIVAVHDSGRADGYVYFSMDYIEGGDLARRLKQGPLAPAAAAALLQKTSEALAHAHAAGVLHRDLKPSNILLDGDEPRLADFGLAAHLDAGGDLTTHTALVGTPHYLAPEALLRGSAALGVASDLYALGVVLFEALTGRTPFAGATPSGLALAVQQSEPPAPSLLVPAVPRDLETICLKCLERDPARRYGSAAALAEDLRRFLASEPISAQPPGAIYLFQKFARRHRAVVAAAAAIAVVLVTATAVSLRLFVRARDAEQKAVAEAAVARAVGDFLSDDLLGQASPRENSDRDLRLRTVLDRAAKRIDGRFAEQPLVEIRLREKIGATFFSLGEYAAARPQFERAVSLSRVRHGPDDARTLDLGISLAAIRFQLGERVEAERDLAQLRERAGRELGPAHATTLEAAMHLAQMMRASGRSAPATAILREARAGRLRLFGAEAAPTLETEGLLAEVLSAQGLFAESQALQAAVLEKQRRVLGADHPATIQTLVSMGLTCYGAGQLAESIARCREALERSRRVNGPESPHTITIMGHLATSLRANGDLEEAERLLRESLPVVRRTRGPEHAATLSVMFGLASIHRARDHPAEAEALLRECLAAYRRAAGGVSINALLELVAAVQDQGRLEEAETLAQEALEFCRGTFGAAHPTTSNAMGQLAAVRHDQARYAEALALHEATTELRRKILGTDNVSTLTSYYQTAGTLLRLGRADEAASLASVALEGRQRQLSPSHASTLLARDRLAQALMAQGGFDEARALLQENLERRQKAGNEPWRILGTQSLLGEALAGLGRAAEAEALLVDSGEKLAALAATLPVRSRAVVAEAAARLADFYAAAGREADAGRWRGKLPPASPGK